MRERLKMTERVVKSLIAREVNRWKCVNAIMVEIISAPVVMEAHVKLYSVLCKLCTGVTGRNAHSKHGTQCRGTRAPLRGLPGHGAPWGGVPNWAHPMYAGNNGRRTGVSSSTTLVVATIWRNFIYTGFDRISDAILITFCDKKKSAINAANVNRISLDDSTREQSIQHAVAIEGTVSNIDKRGVVAKLCSFLVAASLRHVQHLFELTAVECALHIVSRRAGENIGENHLLKLCKKNRKSNAKVTKSNMQFAGNTQQIVHVKK